MRAAAGLRGWHAVLAQESRGYMHERFKNGKICVWPGDKPTYTRVMIKIWKYVRIRVRFYAPLVDLLGLWRFLVNGDSSDTISILGKEK